ncbi:DUF4003 family protein [Oceanobacillus halotolerans]|uniref:DUF4003 family protein n=1 Tax=Oceanobacillus halotolerans TaxID=2663380 RepID=UPI0013DCB998|nr:DUF4003 family protein [Oceanobacillus halotolerans]
MHNEKIATYTKTYQVLKDGLKWKVMEKQVLMSIASIYTMHQKQLDVGKLIAIADKLKQKASLFSAMRSHSRFTTAAFLDVHFDQPEEAVDSLFDIYHAFKQVKFKSGTYTYIAASIVLTNKQVKDPSNIIEKAKTIYDGMKQEHGFLTSTNDYPLAVLLAYEDRDDLMEHIERFYERLSQDQFKKGNELQFLSHILSLSQDESHDTLVNRSISMYEEFKKAGIKPKSMYYPVFGMLSLLPPDTVDMQKIHSMYQELNKQKDLKWQKDMNVMMAVCLYVQDQMDHTGLAEASIYTTLETMMQAQQAVMIATVAGATAAASSSSGSN